MCLALVVGNMIGSGIFLLPANLAPYGLNAIWGWVITIGGAMCLATVFAAWPRRCRMPAGPMTMSRGAMGAAARLPRHVELLDFHLGDQRGHRHRRGQLPELAVAGFLRRAGRRRRWPRSPSSHLFTAVACTGRPCLRRGPDLHQRPQDHAADRGDGDRADGSRPGRSAGAVCADARQPERHRGRRRADACGQCWASNAPPSRRRESRTRREPFPVRP